LKRKKTRKEAQVDTQQLLSAAQQFVHDKSGWEIEDVIIPPDPNQYSFSLWFYLSGNTTDQHTRSVFFHGNSEQFVVLALGRSPKLEFHHNISSSDRCTITDNEHLPIKTWIHVTCTCDVCYSM